MEEVIKAKLREEIGAEYKWKVEKIYASIASFQEDFIKLKKDADSLKEYSGKLADPKELLAYLRLSEAINRRAELLLMYAHLRGDEDTANSEFQGLKSVIDVYYAELKSYEAFFVPEILTLNEDFLQVAIIKEPELKLYEFFLKDIIKLKPHFLTKDQEEIMAGVSDCLEAPANIFSMLSNADMTFPSIIDEEGNNVELTEANYSQFIRSKDRRVREEAFKTIFNTYDKYKNTFSMSLTSSIKNFIFNSKTRKYKSSLEASLKPNEISLKVYDNVIKTINDNLSSLHKYVAIKKRHLGLEEMHMYDLYVPVVDTPKENIEFNSGVEIIKKALVPLGLDYLEIFEEGIKEGWIDVYSNKGKRKGAYSWGSYDTMPYVLLNYNNELNDVSTLAHEMGHSIHSYLSKRHQPYIYSSYTLFCAEVASTTNEALLIRYLIENEKDKMKRDYLINTELEQIRTTVFRQAMFAEFEKVTHENLERGLALTSKELSDIWHKLNEKYFGTDMIVDKEIDMEWARIPHFYNDFYVYQYTTGYAAANSFATMILKGGAESVAKYKNFLNSGGKDYPIKLLYEAGVDMSSPKPLLDTIERFNQLLNML